MNYFILVTVFFISLTSFATQTPKLRIPKSVSAFNHKINFTSPPQLLKKTKSQAVYAVFYLARWGVHRTEYGQINYLCKANKCEQISEPIRLSFFERCDGLTAQGKPLCDGLVPSDHSQGGLDQSNEQNLICEMNPEDCRRDDSVDGTLEPAPSEDPLF